MAETVKVNIYNDLRQSLADAMCYERGQRIGLRVMETVIGSEAGNEHYIVLLQSLHKQKNLTPAKKNNLRNS
jgi:hypothetical protein